MSTNTSADSLQTGQRVSIPKSGNGVIAFIGQTQFAPGKWIGIALDEALGKNDGSVQGVRYFDADSNYGVFVRPGQVTVLETAVVQEGEDARPASSAQKAGPDAQDTDDQEKDGDMPPPPVPSRTPAPKRTGLLKPTAATPSARTSTLSTPSSSRPSSVVARTSTASQQAAAPKTRKSNDLVDEHETPPQPARSSLVAAARAAHSARLSGVATGTPATTPGRATPGIKRTSSSTSNTSGPMTGRLTPLSATNTPSTSTTTRRQSMQAASAQAAASMQAHSGPGSVGTPLSRRSSMASTASAMSRPPSSVAMQRNLSSRSANLSPLASPPLGSTREANSLSEILQPAAEILSPRDDPFSLATKGKDDKKSLSEQTVPLRTHEETLLRLKILETRHAETRAQMKDYETLKSEHTQFTTNIKPKLQARLVELSNETKDLKKRVSEAESERDRLNSKFDELQDEVELHTLDKEMAEEKAEAAESALSETKDRLSELQVEVEVLREEAAKVNTSIENAKPSDGERSSVAFIHLERQNERLKDVLARLRDLTAENDSEHRRRVADLEKELELTADLQADYDQTLVRAETAELQLEDLKLQLDDAMGAEDLLEQLTERNLTLNEKMEEMRGIIEDLEALKELNDELEETHVETEKQLLEEIDAKDLQALDQQRKVDMLEESVYNYEATIGQFRDLVTSLQSDIDHLREQQTVAEFDAKNLNSQTQGMLDLNLKLQSTVAKAQIKSLDLELRKMEKRHAVEQLSVVKPYLPPIFFEEDSDAVEALMFFDRLSRKSALISEAIATKHNIGESLNSVVSEQLVHICEVRGKLSRFSILTSRFAANLRRCSPEIFLKMGQAYRELVSIEKKLDSYIDQLRQDKLKETDCGREVDRFIAQAGHLAEVNLGESGLDLGEMQLGQALSLDVDFDTFIAGIGYSKQTVAVMLKETEGEIPDSAAFKTDIFEPIQSLIDQARSAQTNSRKLHRRFETLLSQNEFLVATLAEPLADLVRTVHLLGNASIRMAHLVTRYCSELRTGQQAISIATILGIASEATTDLGFRSGNVMAALDTELSLAVSRLASVTVAASDANNATGVSYVAPWLERVAQISRANAINTEGEQKAARLADELSQVMRDFRSKEQTLQENAVKIELMEKRAEHVKQQVEALNEIEAELAKAKKQEKAYEEALEALHADMEAIEKENVKLKQNPVPDGSGTSNHHREGTGNSGVVSSFLAGNTEADALAFSGSLETAQLLTTIESLRGSVRYLQRENAFLQSRDLAADLASLKPIKLATAEPVKNARSEHARKVNQDVKALWKDALANASMPKVVDFSSTKAENAQSRVRQPELQMLKQKEALDKLASRMRSLTFEVEALSLPNVLAFR